MKLNKLFAYMIISLVLGACVGENGSTASEDNSNKSMASRTVMDNAVNGKAEIAYVDESVEGASDQRCKIEKSSAGSNSVKVSLSACLGSEYDSEGKHWINAENKVTGSFRVTFGLQGAPKGFRLQRIYTETNNAPLAGVVKQVDATACNNLVGSGLSANKSCLINFTIKGVNYTEAENKLHFVFGSDENLELLDFVAPVKNIQEKASFNIGIINDEGVNSSTGINYLINPTVENENGTALVYSDTYTNELENVGKIPIRLTSKELEQNPDEPTIEAKLSPYFGGAGIGKLYFTNNYHTSCAQGEVGTDLGENICLLRFTKTHEASARVKTEIGGFNHYYFLSPENQESSSQSGSRKVFYNQFAYGQGDLEPKDYKLNVIDDKIKFEVNKLNVQDDSADGFDAPKIKYAIPLKNLKFSIENNPVAYIGYQDGDKGVINYAYGTQVDAFVNSLQVVPEASCFTDAANEDANISLDQSKVSCEVTIYSTMRDFGYMLSKLNQPLSFLLYADYDSPTYHKQIKQLVGTVTVKAEPLPLPEGSYKSYYRFRDFTFDGVTLNAYSPDHRQVASLDYSHTCQANSTVSALVSDSGGALLKCDTLSSYFPQGDYSNSCANLTYKNGVLEAQCKYFSSLSKYDMFQRSKLNYNEKCQNGSTVSIDNYGALKCDRPKVN